MFKRRDYFKEDRQKPWSIKDEPVTCEALADTEARTYPDMFEAYKNFAHAPFQLNICSMESIHAFLPMMKGQYRRASHTTGAVIHRRKYVSPSPGVSA